MPDFPQDRWDATVAISQTAAFVATEAALPGILEQGWGRVIKIVNARKSAFVAAKHGIVGLTKVVTLETATTGVISN